MTKLKNPIRMATIGAAHGIKGELRIKTFTQDPLALGDYGPLFAEDGRPFTIASIRPAKEVVVVRFKEVADRAVAEALSGTALFVDRSRLPDDLEEDEFYHADLIGLAVRDETGVTIGTVDAVQNFGGGDIVEIALPGKHAVLVPFSMAAIPVISIAEGFVQIDRAAAGLFDDEKGETESGDDERPARRDRPRGPTSTGDKR